MFVVGSIVESIAGLKIQEGSYYNAAQYLEDAYKVKPDKIAIAHLLGDVNMYLRDYEAAEKYYKVVITKDPEAFIADQFHLGQMQKMNGRYEDAKKTLEGYIKAPVGKKDISYKALAKIEIEGCDTGHHRRMIYLDYSRQAGTSSQKIGEVICPRL